MGFVADSRRDLRRSFSRSGSLLALLCLLLTAGSALAQMPATASTDRIAALEKSASDNAAAIASAQSAGDNAWMLTSAALVLMMSGPGLALFYGGLVRRKNILGTMMQTFAMMAVITVLWAVVTYSLAFGDGNAFIGNLHNAFLTGVGLTPDKDYAGHDPVADVHDLSTDVRHHHPGAHLGRLRRAHEVLSHAGVHGALGNLCVQPHGAYGLGEARLAKRLPWRQVSLPGLRRGHRRPRHLRRQRLSHGVVSRQAAGLPAEGHAAALRRAQLSSAPACCG